MPEAERSHNSEIEASRLSTRETQIVAEADKALLLLHEDATAVAFPEALEQVRADMAQVADRLGQAKVGQITLSIEQDILTALTEMIEAVKKAEKEMQKSERTPKMMMARRTGSSPRRFPRRTPPDPLTANAYQ